MTEPEAWQTRTPDLLADVRLYSTTDGGKDRAALPGYGCPCFISREPGQPGWDARMQLTTPFEPGTERRVGFVFLTSEGAETMRKAGKFFLWDGRIVGEAAIVR
jgi:hypothetical protein